MGSTVKQVSSGVLKIDWSQIPIGSLNQTINNSNAVSDGAAITLKPGTVVSKPKGWFDILRDNWQLIALGAVAILVLLRG